MATIPPLKELVQEVLDVITPIASQFETLQGQLSTFSTSPSQVSGEFNTFLADLLNVADETLTALLAMELDLQSAVADSYFPVQ